MQFNVLRLPKFLGIDPRPFDPETFEPPVSDHHTNTKSANFSARATAASTVRYRKNPATGKLESNTMIYKWSDGSTTLAVGDQHFELQTKPLAPPQDSKVYQEVQDSHVYFASPSITSQLVVTVGHMTNQFTVRPNKDIEDDALERLQRSLAAAARGGLKEDKGGPELINNTVDPELQKKRAEQAEKERLRAQKRRETAAEKASLPYGRPRGIGGGLTVDDLEGRSGRRAPGISRKPKPGGKRPRRRPDYDTDDELPRGRTREDEYDKEDDFLASSDEELEEGDDDEEEEELLDDESDMDEPRAKKQKSSRQDEGSDADADADLDDEEAPAPVSENTGGRARKRNIIEDDDDDE